MARVPVPLATKAGDVSLARESNTGFATIERLTNLYAERNPEGAKSPFTLYGTEGLRVAGLSSQMTTVDEEGPSGIHVFGDMVIAAVGKKLWKIDALDVVEIGTDELDGISREWTPMGDNGTHVWVATRTKIIYTDGTTVADVTGGDFKAGSITYQDGYLIATEEGTQSFWISGLDDATTINGLDFSTADSSPDNLVAVISDQREIFLFGEHSAEVWVNTGNAAFPFERAPGGLIDKGCLVAASVRRVGGRVLWIGDDRAVYMLNGYQPVRVSSRAVENVIDAIPSNSTLPYTKAYTYSDSGHDFYGLAEVDDDSPVFDLSSGLWHFRDWGVSFVEAFALPANAGDSTGTPKLAAWGYNIGSADTFYLSPGHNFIGESTDSPAVPIIRTGILPPLFAGSQRAAMSRFILDIKPGQGAAAGDGSDATVSLSLSDDLGETWTTAQTVSLEASDKANAYHRQIYWSRLGVFRQRSIKLVITVTAAAGTEVIAITGAFADIEPRA
jgi:hypothetical protein